MKLRITTLTLATALTFGTLAGNNVSAETKTTSSSTQTEKSYLIAFKKDLPSNYQSIISNAGGQILRVIPAIGAMEVKSSNPSFLDNLKGVSSIQAANQEVFHALDKEEIRPTAADGKPVTDIPQPENIDSYWNYQWDIKNITNDGASYKLNGGTGKGATVGVIDSGIDANHPDLIKNYSGGQNFVPAGADETETGDPADVKDRGGHGTHVAGSIAANGKIKGVGPDLKVRSYRVFPESGSAPTAWIVDAIVAAANDNVDVINMSIGGFDSMKYYDNGKKYSDNADVLIWKRAIQYAVQKNVTVIAASGNESLNMNDKKMITDYLNKEYGSDDLIFKGPYVETPGQIPGVINVSSSNQWSTDKIAFYSNYGNSFIDVAAPGGDNGPVYAETGDLAQRDFHYRTLSTWPTYLEPYFTSDLHNYALMHGTSMASPKVAGIAGVIKAAHPTYSPAQVENLIKQTAKDFGKPGHDALFGSGEANIYNALLKIKK
ncbi:S8 family serine peptidase [Bacillus paramycoides]|uniref:S8 family serine peptidase n=1 Tax=Bacillus paramycoides TaxID=2026194 RepID=UPI0038095FE7